MIDVDCRQLSLSESAFYFNFNVNILTTRHDVLLSAGEQVTQISCSLMQISAAAVNHVGNAEYTEASERHT
jgi:hypothetical protein